MSDKKLLAVIVLTYQHSETVREVLPRWLLLLRTLDFDLYYFDSSQDSNTKEFIEENSRNNKRLRYISISPECDAEHKVQMPFNKDFLPKQYCYFWPIKDRVVPTFGLMMKIYMCLINGCDAVEISPKHPNDTFKPVRYKDEYTDCAEFYRDLAWSAIDIQSSIYSYDTVFSHYDERMILERYPEPGFNHTMGFFHYLAEMDSCRIFYVNAGTKECTFLSYPTPSGWRLNNTGLELFGYNWPKTNKALPEIYAPYRLEAVKTETNLPALFGTVDGIMSLNFSDESNREYAELMLSHWDDYSDVPVGIAQAILEKNYNAVYDYILSTINKYITDDDIQNAAQFSAGCRLFIGRTPFYQDYGNRDIFDQLVSYYDKASMYF